MPNNLWDNFFPKQTQVLSANGLHCSSPWSLITTPGHWSGARGTILYALEMSLHAPNDPGGRDHINVVTVANVPQVHGYKSEKILELIDWTLLEMSG